MNDTINDTGTCLYMIAAIIVATLCHSCHTGSQLQGRKSSISEQHDSVLVDKDGNSYAVKRIRNNNLWMTANLKLTIQDSYYYNDSAKYGEGHGRLYTWKAVQVGCASLGEGWRLTTKEDWQELGESYGMIGRKETNIEKRAYIRC